MVMGQCAMLVSAPEHCSRPSNRPNFVRSPLPAAIAADAALYKGIFLDGSVFFTGLRIRILLEPYFTVVSRIRIRPEYQDYKSL